MLDRADQAVLEIDSEATFGAGGLYSGTQLLSRIWDLDLGGADDEMIEDQTYRTDASSPGSYAGLGRCRSGGVSFKHYLEGLGSNSNTGDPTETALSKLLELLYQRAADALAGSTVNTYTNLHEMTEVDNDAHLPALSSGIGICGIQLDSGVVVMRPYTYTAATERLALRLDLPSVTSAGKDLYRALAYQWTVQPAATVSAGMRFVGAADELQAELKGAVCQGKIGSTEPGTIPVLEAEILAASYADDYSDTRVAASNAYAAVMAGGNVIVASYGATDDGEEYRCASVEVDFRGAFTPISDPNRPDGTSGYARSHDGPEVTIQIPIEDAPPSGVTAASWREVARNNLVSGNDIHILIGYGSTPGRQVALYWSRARLVSWARSDVGGLAYQTLTFGLVPGGYHIGAQG